MVLGTIIAGFGGQGILLTGQLIAYAGLLEGKHVAWIPSYGPEMRGGTAHCSVIVSDKKISSPLVERPDAVMVFNYPSLKKFEETVRPHGIVLINTSMVTASITRNDLRSYKIPAGEMAATLGNYRVANMILLGAYLALTGVVSEASIINAFKINVLGKNKPDRQNILTINKKALQAGAQLVVEN